MAKCKEHGYLIGDCEVCMSSIKVVDNSGQFSALQQQVNVLEARIKVLEAKP